MVEHTNQNSHFEGNFREALLVPELLEKLQDLRLRGDGSERVFVEDILYKLYLVASSEIQADLDSRLRAGKGATTHEKLRSAVRTQVVETIKRLDVHAVRFFTEGAAAMSLEESLDSEIERFVAEKKALLDELYVAYCNVATENNALIKAKNESPTLRALEVQAAAIVEA